ncbi:GTP-binding protein [archaeon]|nr:MAG: GTP-binding protein [archaeon]
MLGKFSLRRFWLLRQFAFLYISLWFLYHKVCNIHFLCFTRKTTIMKRVLGEDHNEIAPTVGFNIKTLEYKGYLLNLWDVGGQKSIRAYWRNYFEETDGVIWVVDSVDRFRMEECKAQLRDILKQEVGTHTGYALYRIKVCNILCDFMMSL